MKDAINNMFGFIFKQPIHITLRQMRITHVILLFTSQFMIWEIIQNVKDTDPAQAAIAYTAIAGTLIATIWKSIDGLHKSNKKDEIN